MKEFYFSLMTLPLLQKAIFWNCGEHIGRGDCPLSGLPDLAVLLPAGSFCAGGTSSASKKPDLAFRDSTKHLCSSAAQMFAGCVILSANKSRRKKKKIERVYVHPPGTLFQV